MSDLIYYIFADIPGQHASYSVACLAVSEHDARQHMQRIWGGGRVIMSQKSGSLGEIVRLP